MKKFFKKKLLYIILLILSTIVFAGTMVIRFAVPDNTRPSVENGAAGGAGFSGFQGGSRPDSSSREEGGQSSGRPQGSRGDGSMGEGAKGDGSGRPSFGDGSGRPSFGDGSEFPQNAFNNAGNPGNAQNPVETEKKGLVQFVKKNWIALSVPSLLVMIFSIVALIIVSRMQRREQEEEEAKKLGGLTPDEILQLRIQEEARQEERDKSRRKRNNIMLSILLAILIALALIASKMLSKDNTPGENTSIEEKVVSEDVSRKDIKTVIKGNGNVAFDEAGQVTLPGNVEISAWLVKNGDTVAKGDPIAEVDTESVASAIEDLRALISQLDADLEKARKDTISSKVTATSEGRVIYCYASSGDYVADVVGDYGALMVLSLDGTLSVTLEQKDGVYVGSEVTVTTTEGKTYNGKVATKDQTQMVITVTDDGTTVGDTVTVTDENGTELGSGVLYIHSAQNITGFTGVVDTVKVKAGSKVKVGDVLLTLTDADYSKVYDALMEKRSSLEEQMRRLFIVYASGYLYATESGIISGISDDAVYKASSSNGTSRVAVLVSSGASEPEDMLPDNATTPEEGAPSEELPGEGTPAGNMPEDSTADGNASENNMPGGNVQEGNTPEGNVPEGNMSGENTPGGMPGGMPDTPVGDTEITEEMIALLKQQLLEKIDTMDYATMMKIFDLLNELENGTQESDSQGGNQDNRPGETQRPGNNQGGFGGGSFGGGSFGGGGQKGGNTTTTEEEEIDVSAYEFADTTFCSITNDETISIDFTVDEKYVVLLHEGTEVTIAMDALPGRSFAGSISAIDGEGIINEGGSTKYTVTVITAADTRVLEGMSASVLITREEKKDVLAIPLKAVYEEGNKTIIYTSYDEKADTLGNPVEITLGISDEDNAEVLAGLTEGTQFFYRYAGTVTYNFLNSPTR